MVIGRVEDEAVELALDRALAKDAAYAAADADADEDADEVDATGREGATAEGTAACVPGNAREWAGRRDSTNERRPSHSSVVHPSRLSEVNFGHIQV